MLAQTARDSELGTRTVCLHRQQGIQSWVPVQYACTDREGFRVRYQDSMHAQTARDPE
jgi:hypothetical protein